MTAEPIMGVDGIFVPRVLWEAMHQKEADLLSKLHELEQQSGGFTQEKLKEIAYRTGHVFQSIKTYIANPNETDRPRIESDIDSLIQWYDTQVLPG